LIGSMNLITKNPPPLPTYDPHRAHEIIDAVDSILRWERNAEKERDTRFVELGEHLCEIRVGQYWRAEQLKSFEEFLAKRFPDSRRKAYYLMSIHEQLEPKINRADLRKMGWSKAAELAKVARSARDDFDCATWLHKAEQLPKEEFKAQVESHLTGKETETSEVIYFKLYKSQIPVVEEAIETAAMLLGSDRSRGYCLEMICADFLSGARHSDPCYAVSDARRLLQLLEARDAA
jgi:hypothetical protein